MRRIYLLTIFLGVFVSSVFGEEKAGNVTFEIYAKEAEHEVQIFLKVTNHSDTPYVMEQPHRGVAQNYCRYYKSKVDGKYGDYLDKIPAGERIRGPMITVVKEKPYHFKLYDLSKDLNVIMKVKYRLDSGKEVYTNEIKI